MLTSRDPVPPVIIGRYALYDEIASGGMATVHIGRLLGPVGFSRTVAIKRMHPNLAKDPEFVSMFLDEARLAARIRHPNVIGTLDVVALAGELFLVMEYVHGESLFRLMKTARERQTPIPLPIVSAILVGVLDGLHAAHEATNEREEPLGIVHRDVSPHNVILGASDGLARVLDFGIAKASDRAHSTRDGQIKGKLGYMAPEQLTSGPVDRTSDVYAASVVLWESITGTRLVPGESELKSMVNKVLAIEPEPPSKYAKIPPELDELVLRGLAKEPRDRVRTAREMARALQRIVAPAPASDVAEWVERVAGSVIDERARRVAMIEQATPTNALRPSIPPAAAPARRVSEFPTVAGPARARGGGVKRRLGQIAGLAAAAIALVAVSVAVTRAQTGRADAAASAATRPVEPPAASAPAPSAATPPPASASVAVPATPPVPRADASPAPRPAAPAPRPASARKRPSGEGEFDHVMDSRK